MRSVRRFAARWLLPVLGSALALGVVFWLYRDLDLSRFLAALGGAEPGWIVALGGAILLEQLVQGWKWRQILFDIKPVSSGRLCAALLAGYGANVLVPVGISPLVRAWLVARLEALKMATVLATTIIARFVDGVVFALFAGVVALAGQVPRVQGDLKLGLMLGGGLNIVVFGGLLYTMFRYRARFTEAGSWVCRAFDRIARGFRADGSELRAALAAGVVWPCNRGRRIAVVLGAVAAKAISATHFLWAGLSVSVVLGAFDYLFLMVFAGFSMILARFVRVPGGFVIGSALAFRLLGVPDEQALAMILFNHVMSVLLVVGIGLTVLWRSGIDIRRARAVAETDGV